MSDTVFPARATPMQSTRLIKSDVISDRLFEWIAAVMMIGIAVTLAVWPMSVEAGSLQVLVIELNWIFAYIGFPQADGIIEPLLRSAFLFAGLMRLFALYANGRWPVIGPRLRGIGAGGGALLWSQMSFAVFPSLGSIGSGSLATVVFGCMAIGEIVSCYRSGAHGRWKR